MSTPPPKIEPLIVPRASEIKPPRRPRALIALGLAIIALALLVALTARPGDRRLYPGDPGQAKTTVYIVENGFHSDLVAPRQALFAKPHPAALAAAMATDKPWVAIGWGDARFYSQPRVGLSQALSGLRALLPIGNRSVLHLEGWATAPDPVRDAGVHPIQLTDAGLERIFARVDRSLDLDTDGQPQRIQGPGVPDGGYFKSVERFSLLHVCNHWTADLLDAAGVPTTPVIDTLPIGLQADLKLRAGAK
jgi:uncharacterized protein (TIGR02117 family)